MNLNNKKIFISGGAGVIGQALTLRLIQHGASILVADLKPKPNLFDSPDLSYRQGDLRFLSQDELSSFNPDIIFHLAATFERSTESYPFFTENFQHNTSLSHHLLNLAKNLPSLQSFVFASSYLIYNPSLYLHPAPTGSPTRLSESSPIYPRNLTGSAKLNHETELHFIQNFLQDRCRFIAARIFRGYGCGSKDIISRWVRSLLKNHTIDVYNPENSFDFIYAEDSAEALLRLASHPSASGIYNVGTGQSRKVYELIDILKKHFPSLKSNFLLASPPFEESAADTSKLESTLQWSPSTPLESAIPEIIAYERENSLISTSEPPPHNILITSSSQKIPLIQAVKNAANRFNPDIQVWGGDMNHQAISQHFLDHFWIMPPLQELPPEDLLKFCLKNNIHYIIPTRDAELPYFSQHKSLFLNNNISLLCSDPSPIQTCYDKLLFYKSLKKEGFPVIETRDSLHDLHADNLVVKDQFGSGSRHIALNVPREEALIFASKLKNPIFQPFIHGQELSADVYISKNQKIKGSILRWRNLVLHGESHITTSFSNPTFESIIEDLVSHLNLYGHIVLQAIVDPSQNLHIIEVNPRFGGASSLSTSLGLDSFYWFLLESNNLNLDHYPFSRLPDKTLIRFPQDQLLPPSPISPPLHSPIFSLPSNSNQNT